MLWSAAIAAPAAAQEVRARRPALHWARAAGADGCIDPPQLARGVEQIVGPVFQSPSSAEFTLEATVSRTGAGFSMVARTLDEQGAELGRRALAAAAANCRALDALWIFVLALMLDPHAALLALPPELEAQLEGGAGAALLAELRSEAVAAGSAETADPLRAAADATAPPESAPRAEHVARAEPATAERTPARPVTTVRTQIAAGPIYGVGPALSAALALGLELERAWWMLRTRASGWLPRSTRIDDDPAHSARFAGAQLHLFACPSQLALKALRADACLGGFVGLLHARAYGLTEAEPSLRPTYGLALEARIAWPLTPAFALGIAASGQWNARRDRFYVSSGGTDSTGFQLPGFGAAGWLALMWTPGQSTADAR
jgi:hypothetical protein